MRTRILLFLAIFLASVSMTFAQGVITRPTKPQGNSVSNATGKINGYEYVDLGLSVKWAKCNVGASSPTSYGSYYAWGETTIKSQYTEKNCITSGKSISDISGNSKYDTARANWGGTWRLPTAKEFDELKSKCKREWTTVEGVKGYKVTGPNGNSIFLPAAGWRDGTSLNSGGCGFYWSSTPSKDTQIASVFIIDNNYFSRIWVNRDFGRSVRAVSE